MYISHAPFWRENNDFKVIVYLWERAADVLIDFDGMCEKRGITKEFCRSIAVVNVGAWLMRTSCFLIVCGILDNCGETLTWDATVQLASSFPSSLCYSYNDHPILNGAMFCIGRVLAR